MTWAHGHQLPRSGQAAHSIDLKPTSGLRACACLGVLIGHCMFWVARSAADKQAVYAQLDAHPWMIGLLKMPQPFMDVFLVLTGFLTAHSLLPGLAAAPSYSAYLCRYYQGRLVRVAPSLYSMLAIVYCAVLPAITAGLISADARRAFVDVDPFNEDNCPRLLWASFAFVNNHLPFAGCASHTWSMAVQMQFYFTAPLALLLLQPKAPGFRARVACACAVCIAAVLAHRWHVMHAIELWRLIPVPFYGPWTLETRAKMFYMWAASYLSLASHLAALSLGVLAYLALSSPAFMSGLARHQGKVACAAAALLALMIADCRTNSYGARSDPGHPAANPAVLALGFVLVTGLLQPLLPALALLLACAQLPGPSAALRRVLTLRPLRWVADISYDVYLLHPIVILCIWSALPPSRWFDPARGAPFALVTLLVLALSLAAAAVHGRAVGVLTALAGRMVRLNGAKQA